MVVLRHFGDQTCEDETRVASPVVYGDGMVRCQLLVFLIRRLHDLESAFLALCTYLEVCMFKCTNHYSILFENI